MDMDMESATGADREFPNGRHNRMHLQAQRRTAEEARGSRTVQTQPIAENRDSPGGKSDRDTASTTSTTSIQPDCNGATETLHDPPATEGEQQVLVSEAGCAARDGGGGLALPHHPCGEHESDKRRRGWVAEEVGPAVVVGQEEEEEDFGLGLYCALSSQGCGASTATASSSSTSTP